MTASSTELNLRASKASQDNICLICLDDIPAGSPRTKLPCHHATWHVACISEWMRRNPRCPLCNAQVSVRSAVYRGRFQGEGWRLWERRVHEEGAVMREGRPFASQDLSWLLSERRLSRATPLHRGGRRFGRSASDRR